MILSTRTVDVKTEQVLTDTVTDRRLFRRSVFASETKTGPGTSSGLYSAPLLFVKIEFDFGL